MNKSTVAVVHNSTIPNGINEALGLLGDLSDIFRDRHVAIKPNDTTAQPDDLTACTQADTLQATIRYIKRFNPRQITVTGGSGAGETDQVFGYLGLDKVIEEENVGFVDHNRPPFQSLSLGYGPQKVVMVHKDVFAYDTIVSLAQHKVHGTATVTLTMKNIAMSFPAADYYGHPRWTEKHEHNFFQDIHGFIVGMCEKFPLRLGIIVGHPAMVGQGPVGGYTFESDLIIASRDCVAADFVGAMILGFDSVRHIEEAQERGLGKAHLDSIRISGIQLDEAMDIFTEKAREVLPV